MRHHESLLGYLIRRFKKRLNKYKIRRTGLALGGGAVLGAAHIGVLRALEEFDITIDYISGTSIGSFIGTLYAFGLSPNEIERLAINLDWLDISKFSVTKFGVLSNEGLGELIKEELGDVSFSDAKIPLAIVATDIMNGEKIVLNEGKIIPAVMASTCIPGIFKPITHKGRLLVDGGIVENVPTSMLREMGATYVIGVDLTTTHMRTKPEDILGVLLNTFDIAFKYQTKIQMADADVIINLDLSNFNPVDTKQVPDLIKQGYHDMSQQYQNILRKG
jgi:NTE family protein